MAPKLTPELEEKTWDAIARPFSDPGSGERYRPGQLARSVRRMSWQRCWDPYYRRWAAELEADRERSLEDLVSELNSGVESDDWEIDCE